MTRRFVGFVLAGGVAAVVNIGSRIFFSLIFSYEIAVVMAYICGMITAFTLNRVFVFKSAPSGQTSKQGFRFVIVNFFALAQVWIVGVGLARILFPRIGFVWHAELVAHVIAVGSPVIASYFSHKHFTFAAKRPNTKM